MLLSDPRIDLDAIIGFTIELSPDYRKMIGARPHTVFRLGIYYEDGKKSICMESDKQYKVECDYVAVDLREKRIWLLDTDHKVSRVAHSKEDVERLSSRI